MTNFMIIELSKAARHSRDSGILECLKVISKIAVRSIVVTSIVVTSEEYSSKNSGIKVASKKPFTSFRVLGENFTEESDSVSKVTLKRGAG